ncbi:hypothetical protein CBS147332_8839 [Penicillium roqueforti]|nr:hypothetical protein CBS147332_8839 [Penicillium roqueforti]KAI3103886.1 hypothetical protein CBS147331_7490 [Penicillium roqueforti]
MSPFFLVVSLWQATLVTASALCATGCQTAVSNNEFSGISILEDYYSALCQNSLQVKATFICMRDYCPEDEIAKGWNDLNQVCEQDGGVELLPWSIIDDVTDAETKSWPILTYEDIQLGSTFNTSVSVDQSLFQLAYQTTFDWDDQTTRRTNYGYATIGFWGLIVLFGALDNLFRYLNNLSVLRSRTMTRFESSVRRLVVVPPILKKSPFTRFCGIPSTSRLQAMTISAFFVINIILMCVEYRAFENNLYFTRKSSQLWRYIADRAAVMAISNLPVMWLFSTRNNCLLWATSWEFGTFNTFHRWIGRACAIEVFVHGMGVCIYQYQEVGKEFFLPLWKERDFYMGVVAALSIIVTCLLASSGIRRAAYELFLIVHQAFAVLILAALWYHLTVDGPDHVPYLWPCIAVWSFDRLGRVFRLLIWNKPTSHSSGEYNSDADLIQVKARIRRVVAPQPGSYFYVYGWRSLHFWESHPFTLSGWNTVNTEEESYTELVFLIGVHGGFTSRLRKQLLRQDESGIDSSSSVRKVHLAVEGPYGPHFDPWNSEMAVFVIGGAGITIATSFIQQLVDFVRLGKHVDQKIKCLKVIWAIKNIELYRFVYERYISTWEAVFASTYIEISLDVYLTSPSKADQQVELPIPESQTGHSATKKKIRAVVSPVCSMNLHASEEKVASEEVHNQSAFGPLKTNFIHGRPIIRDVIRSQVESFNSYPEQQIALIGCGPDTMAHDIRLSFAESSKETDVNIIFHLAPFGW